MCSNPHHDYNQPNTRLASVIMGGAIIVALLLGIAIVQRNQVAAKVRQEQGTTTVAPVR